MGLRTILGLKPKKAAPVKKERPGPPLTLRMAEAFIEPAFPIDVVYTWVDGSDPAHREKLARFASKKELGNPSIAGAERFTDNDELRYSLRSIDMFAPWVNHIYIITDNQRPEWLAEHPKITIVDHSEILDVRNLPIFNSSALDSVIHRIPGLSEHYIAFNDDMLLLRPVLPCQMFTAGGLMLAHVSRKIIPEGTPARSENDYIWGLKNARDLCIETWGQHIPRRFEHMHRPQKRSVAEWCEQQFAGHYDAIRSSRFRSPANISTVPYLHNVAAYLNGEAVLVEQEPYIVDTSRSYAPQRYREILADAASGTVRIAACFNDTHMSKPELPNYRELFSEFLTTYFPEPSRFERGENGQTA